MNAIEFLQNPNKHVESGLFFICGGQRYLTQTATNKLVEVMGTDQMNTDFVSNMEVFPSACLQYPCFSDKKTVVVKDCELFFKGDSKKVLSTLDDLPSFTKVIFSLNAETGKKKEGAVNVDKRKALYKYLMKNAVIVDTSSLSQVDLERWVVSTAKKNSLAISRANAEEIIRVCGDDMYVLQNEIIKLSYLGEFSKQNLMDIASRTTEFNSFAFHDLMISGNFKEAEALLAQIFAELKSYIPVVANIASKFRLMSLAKSYNYAKELAKIAGVHEYPAKLAIAQCKPFSKEKLSSAICSIADYDLALKSGIPTLPMMAFCMQIYKK